MSKSRLAQLVFLKCNRHLSYIDKQHHIERTIQSCFFAKNIFLNTEINSRLCFAD